MIKFLDSFSWKSVLSKLSGKNVTFELVNNKSGLFRLRLMDILVQPMQRLTKYGLLLKAILKNTDEDVERESLQTMVSSLNAVKFD